MSETPLRSLLASFQVEVDKAGNLAKGNAQVDALKKRLEQLQAAAKPAAQAVGDAFAKAVPSAFTQRAQARAFKGRGSEDAFLGLGQTGGPLASPFLRPLAQAPSPGLASPLGGPIGPQFGPTRDTLNAARAATAAAEEAAAQYAGTLRGKLAGAVQAVRDGFNRGGGGGEGGGGLIASLSNFRTQVQLLAGSAVVLGIKRLVDGLADVENGARRLGVSTDEFQRLEVLAKRNGTSVEALGVAFKDLSKAAVEPTKETQGAFAALGVETKDASGQFKSASDLFWDTSAALAGVTDETKRNAYAQNLMGRSALELKPIFANGTQAVRDQQAALQGLSVTSQETIERAKHLQDSWGLIGPAFRQAADPLIRLLLRGLQALSDWILRTGLPAFQKFLKNTDWVSVAMTALAAILTFKVVPGLQLMTGLGGGVTRTLLGMAGSAAKAAIQFARMALPLLILEDIVTFLRGGDSELGRLLDSIFGKGTAEHIQEGAAKLGAALKDLWEWMTGKGAGEKAKQLFSEIAAVVKAMTHDLLHFFGLTKTGATLDDIAGATKTVDANGNILAGDGSIAVPAYGPPTAAQAGGKGGTTTVGPTTVNITMGQSASAADVGRVVADRIDERNRLMAPVATF